MDRFINKTFCRDNLDLIKEIPNNSIDLIYCDVLYGTGRNFGDYKDIKANKKKVAEFYIPRIKEMHRILKETGSIYIHMDWRINHWLRCIMDDIFGYDNFQNEIIWSYKRWGGKARKFQSTHDNILFYSKTNQHIFNEQYVLTDRLKKIYKQGYNTNNTRSKGKQIIITNKSKVKHIDLSQFDNVVYKKPKGALLNDVWEFPILASNSKERVDYPTQKPKALIERIIKASSNKGDIVADFFCGSGTTPVVAKKLGRKYIACDISERAIDITNSRLNNI